MHTEDKREKRQEQRLMMANRNDLTRNGKLSSRIFYCLSSLLFLLCSIPANAQCAMCRAALEGEGNTAKAEAVNDGIVYLMAIPYLLVAAIFYYIYRTQIGKKKS